MHIVLCRTLWAILAMAMSVIYTFSLNENELAIYAICMSTIALPIAISDSVLGISSTISAPISLKKTRVSFYKFLIINILATPLVIFSVLQITKINVSILSLICILICYSLRDLFIRILARDNASKVMLRSGIYGLLTFFLLTFLIIINNKTLNASNALFIASVVVFLSILLGMDGKITYLFDFTLSKSKKISSKEYFLVMDNVVSWFRFQVQLIITSFYFELSVVASMFAARIMISPLLQISPILTSIILPRLTHGSKDQNSQYVLLLISLLALSSIVYGVIIYIVVDYLDIVFRNINFILMKDFLLYWLILACLYLISPVLNTLYIAELKLYNKLVYNLLSAITGISIMCFFGWLGRHDLFLTGLISAECMYLALMFNKRFL